MIDQRAITHPCVDRLLSSCGVTFPTDVKLIEEKLTAIRAQTASVIDEATTVGSADARELHHPAAAR